MAGSGNQRTAAGGDHMGPGNHEHVGESQSGLIMVSPTVSAHTQNMYGRTAPLRVMR
jgi:hypothetical protein